MIDVLQEAVTPKETPLGPAEAKSDYLLIHDCIQKLGFDERMVGQETQFLFNRYLKAIKKCGEKDDFATAHKDLKDIASGTFHGQPVPDTVGRTSNFTALQERMMLMELYAHNPDFVRAMVEHQIAGGHGATSATLPGVCEYGLRPQKFLRDHNVVLMPSEGLGSGNVNKEYVSFAQWQTKGIYLSPNYISNGVPLNELTLKHYLDLYKTDLETLPSEHLFYDAFKQRIKDLESMLAFLQKEPKTKEEELHDKMIRANFPVVYFVDAKTYNPTIDHFSKTPNEDIALTSMHREFAVKGGVEKRGIKIIAVPRDRIDFVKDLTSLAEDFQVEVFPLEDLQATL